MPAVTPIPSCCSYVREHSDFFELSSGFAGEFIQRIINLRLRTAAVFDPKETYSERFREFMTEARGHPQFRVFTMGGARLVDAIGSRTRFSLMSRRNQLPF